MACCPVEGAQSASQRSWLFAYFVAPADSTILHHYQSCLSGGVGPGSSTLPPQLTE